MTNVETLSPDPSLTGATGTQESKEGSAEPTGESLLEGAKNWQHALQQKAEKLKQAEEARLQVEEELRLIKSKEKERELESLSETERYKRIAEENAQKAASLELKFFVREQLEGKNLPSYMVELITETPWAIPPVKRELGDSFTWDEAISAVKRHLPNYIDSIAVKATTTTEEPVKMVDSERYASADVQLQHTYTQEEVKRIAADPKEWVKHKDKIFAQMAKYGGSLPQ